MTQTQNSFELLSKINVNEHVEKKDKFNYLSWAFAVAELRKNFPDATWEIKRFNGLPFLQTPLGYFVEVEVIVNGVAMSQIHPVLDNRNRVIKEPDAFQINTSIQRCLVKAIALHGLGLYIYAGEDLPIDEEPQKQKEATKPVDDRTNDPAFKAKYNLLKGSSDGYMEFIELMKSKGHSFADMDAYMTGKINERKAKKQTEKEVETNE